MTIAPAQEPQIRAAGYCRISSDPKDKREGVERQKEDVAALCEVKGWRLTAMYVDNDRSASNGKERPEWERLLADIQAGKIDAVAAWDQDRVNRMMDDLQRYRKVFTKHGVLLATSNGGDIDLSTPTGVLHAQIKTAMAEHDIAMMKIRQRRAAKQKAQKGTPNWKRAFGYLCDTHQPDPVTAPLVKQAYAAIIAGASLNDICRLWNGTGAFGLNGRPWTASLMSQFLRKPRNAGLRAHNGEIVGKGTWPPLVDESTWRAAQSVLDAPGRAPGRKTVRRHLLTGVLLCGNPGCGGRLSGMQNMQKKIVYRCKQCLGVAVLAELVEPVVFELVAGRLAMPDAIDLLKSDVHDEAEAEQLRAEKANRYAELDNLAVERAQGLLTGRQVQIASELVQQQIDALERKEQDQERLRVFDGIPLGEPEAVEAVAGLSPDRYRAVLGVIAAPIVMPTGKRGHVFNRDRIKPNFLR